MPESFMIRQKTLNEETRDKANELSGITTYILPQWIKPMRQLEIKGSSRANMLQPVTLLLAWINNHLPGLVMYELIYPFRNFTGGIIEVWKWIKNVISHIL